MVANVLKQKNYSYPDASRKSAIGNMEVSVNPESYSQKITFKFYEKQSRGTIGKIPKFSKMELQKLDFELQFDTIGVINGVQDDQNGVEAELARFKRV
jgi:hypothetical protein